MTNGHRKEEKISQNIRVAVNIRTKEICIRLSDEKLHDSTMMKKLVKHVLNNITIILLQGEEEEEETKSILS